jgi:hypothetical protein
MLLFHAPLLFPWTDVIYAALLCNVDVSRQMTRNTDLPCTVDVSRQMRIYAALPCSSEVSRQM